MSEQLRIVVAGASGRVGRAVLPLLTGYGVSINVISRADLEAASSPAGFGELVTRVAEGGTLLNLAGRAHLSRRTSDTDDLWQSNVALPLMLLEVADQAMAPFIHLSSTKAGTASTPYAISKRCAEVALRVRTMRSKISEPVVCVRTCAVLAPPFEAGKLSVLARVPPPLGRYVPDRTVPVISPSSLAQTLLRLLGADPDSKFRIAEVPTSEMMSLREVLRQLGG